MEKLISSFVSENKLELLEELKSIFPINNETEVVHVLHGTKVAISVSEDPLNCTVGNMDFPSRYYLPKSNGLFDLQQLAKYPKYWVLFSASENILYIKQNSIASQI